MESSSAYITPFHVQLEGPLPQLKIIAAGILSCFIVVAWTGQEDLWLVGFILTVLCAFLLPLGKGTSYGVASDVVGLASERGVCDVSEHDDPAAIVRSLYQFASFPTTRTSWPVVFLYSFLAAIALRALATNSTSWSRAVFINFVVIVAVEAYISSFRRVHGDAQAQIFLDALYCRYQAARALRAGRLSATGVGAHGDS